MQVRLYNNRGYCLAKLGKYRAAVADYNKVLELDQTNCHAYHNRLVTVQTGTACQGLVRLQGTALLPGLSCSKPALPCCMTNRLYGAHLHATSATLLLHTSPGACTRP